MSPGRSSSPLRRACLEALTTWSEGSLFAETIIENTASRHRLDHRDRAFLNALLLGVLRNLSLLDHWIDQLRDGRTRPATREILRVGFYQTLCMRVPDHAAVNETVALARNPQERKLVNALLREAIRQRPKLLADTDTLPPETRFSIPEFFISRWSRAFGPEHTEDLCKWNNTPAPLYIRVNDLRAGAREAVAAQDVKPFYADSRFVQIEELPENLLADGLAYAQDPSTALACDLLAPGGDDRVLDACAAPGGKTALLAQLMENRGEIVACDASARRLETLQANLRRLAVTNTRTLVSEFGGVAYPGELHGALFDRILVDAPCSNTGVLRRRVDVRWRLTPRSFAEMAQVQRRILDSSLPLLRPGGSLVYSTCSLEPEENEDLVDQLLASFPGTLELRETRRTTPFQDGIDGAFAALLVKTTS